MTSNAFRSDAIRRVCLAAALVGFAPSISQPSLAADWPSWRGPTRDGHTVESSGWMSGGWPLGNPAWETQVGEGCSSPIVVRGRLYTVGWENDQDAVVCLDATSGHMLWRQAYDAPRYGRYHVGDEVAYSGPTPTPEFDPATGFLYTLSADGELKCWDTAADGQRVWELNLYDAYDVRQRPNVGGTGANGGLRDYGYVTAPLVYGDWLVVAVGAAQGHLMAFDKRNGQLQWASESKEPAGHCGGLARIDVKGTPCLASLSLRKLVVIRLGAENPGSTLATFDWATDFGNNVASPTVHENNVLLTSAYNHMAICKVEVSLDGAKKVWEAPYHSGACTPVVNDGKVYWIWEKMHCLDFDTGKQEWEGGSFGTPGSCIATSDGKIIAWGGRGKLVLVQPGEKYHELSRNVRLFQTYCWPHVALSENRLYCKDRDGNLKCFELAREKR